MYFPAINYREPEERALGHKKPRAAKPLRFARALSTMVRRQRDGGMIFLDPSRFLAEIPENLLQNAGGFF